MKTSQLLITLIAFILGAALVAGIGSFNSGPDEEMAAQLAEAQAEIAKLKEGVGKREVAPKLSSLPSAMPDRVSDIAVTDATEPGGDEEGEEGEGSEEEDPAAMMAKLFNSKEARGFMKKMSEGFAQRGEQWIEQGITEYTDKLNLSDAQVASLKARLGAEMDEQMAMFNAKLDDESLSMQEIMQEQREVMMGQEDVMAEILREELDEDQFAEYEREQLVEKTERVQSESQRSLERLDSQLDLTESQEDQVFGILVQKNRSYDESMALEGVDQTATVSADVSQEDAIREVLDPEQTEKYNQSLERRQRGPWGRGFGGGFGGR